MQRQYYIPFTEMVCIPIYKKICFHIFVIVSPCDVRTAECTTSPTLAVTSPTLAINYPNSWWWSASTLHYNLTHFGDEVPNKWWCNFHVFSWTYTFWVQLMLSLCDYDIIIIDLSQSNWLITLLSSDHIFILHCYHANNHLKLCQI